MQHPDIKQLDQAKRIKVHARVRPTQLNYSWFGRYPMILSRQSLGFLPIRARCDCRSQLSRPWTFWYSIYSYLYVYFFQGDSRMALMMQSNVKDTYYWESLRYKYWIILGDGKKAMANCSSHWGAGPWRDFPSNWVVDVDGDSSFDWGKTLGPSKPVFLGIKCSLPWSLGSIILCSYLWHDLFLNSHNVRLRHLFSIKSFTGKRTAPNKCSGPWRSDASSRFRVHEKFFPPVAGLRQKSSSEINQ